MSRDIAFLEVSVMLQRFWKNCHCHGCGFIVFLDIVRNCGQMRLQLQLCCSQRHSKNIDIVAENMVVDHFLKPWILLLRTNIIGSIKDTLWFLYCYCGFWPFDETCSYVAHIGHMMLWMKLQLLFQLLLILQGLSKLLVSFQGPIVCKL